MHVSVKELNLTDIVSCFLWRRRSQIGAQTYERTVERNAPPSTDRDHVEERNLIVFLSLSLSALLSLSLRMPLSAF